MRIAPHPLWLPILLLAQGQLPTSLSQGQLDNISCGLFPLICICICICICIFIIFSSPLAPFLWSVQTQFETKTSLELKLLNMATWLAHRWTIFLCYLGCDQHRNPNMNNKDHLIGQLTATWCDLQQYKSHSFQLLLLFFAAINQFWSKLLSFVTNTSLKDKDKDNDKDIWRTPSKSDPRDTMKQNTFLSIKESYSMKS